ncbi:hypothetical protein ABZ656_10480 [Streptomyces sp. NPDC007095]|jgi:hypothetical protein|uniref:hypothetical protein n=1 Tax=Streptomyces sp. NPDC007095 TaxID=3154482 RepID=UPI0033D05E12
MDGKTVRGSRTSEERAVALLVAMDHNGTVPAQWQIADKSNEIPAFAPLLDTFDDLDGGVITADALHTQHGHGTYMRRLLRGDRDYRRPHRRSLGFGRKGAMGPNSDIKIKVESRL